MTLYLKYRPKNLDELDLPEVSQSLKKIVKSDKISHAFLFAGPKGTGPSYLAEELLKEAQKSKKNCVIESIRTEGEVNALRKIGGFFLLAVDADPRKRYERIIKRGGETDHITFEEFLEDEKREMTSKDPNKQNLKRCIGLADYKINNDGTFEDLDKRISEIIHEIQETGKERKK